MARPLRPLFAGATYHVFTRGVDRMPIIRDAEDARLLVRQIGTEVDERAWSCLAFCVMPNHLHLLLQTPAPDLGEGMQRALGRYARLFNDRHGRVGHLFGDRYGSRLVESAAYRLWLLRYIARNPVKAQLCETPDEWPWSSHPTVAGLAPRWSFVAVDQALACTGGRAGYLEHVGGRIGSPSDLDALLAAGTPEALLFAHEELGASLRAIAEALGVSYVTVHRRIAAARALREVAEAPLAAGPRGTGA